MHTALYQYILPVNNQDVIDIYIYTHTRKKVRPYAGKVSYLRSSTDWNYDHNP